MNLIVGPESFQATAQTIECSHSMSIRDNVKATLDKKNAGKILLETAREWEISLKRASFSLETVYRGSIYKSDI